MVDLDRIPPAPDLSTTDVDYKGVVYGTQLAIHFMRKNKTPGGKIVTTASAAAIVPHETYPEYDGAKAAVVNFVRATARILRNVSLSTFGETANVFGRKRTSISIAFVQVYFDSKNGSQCSDW